MKTTPLLTTVLVAWFCTATHGKCADPTNAPWKGSLTAGLTLTRGNSETVLTTLTADATKKWGANELLLGADAAYGQNKDQNTGLTAKSAESARAVGQYNRLFNERLYGYARAEALHDGIATIRYRVTVSPGAGYYFIKEKRTDLSAEVGPGYIWDDLGGVTRHYPVFRIGEKFHHQLSDRARVWQTAEWLPDLGHPINFIANAEIGIEADLNQAKSFSLRSYIDDTFNNIPAANHKKNDIKLVTAIAYKF